MAPHEILASESQERMLLIVTPENLQGGARDRRQVGRAARPTSARSPTPAGWSITWHGETVVDVPPGSLADDGPVYARPMREPADLPLLQADRAETLPRPRTGDELRGDAAADGREPEPVRQDLGHRAVRPVRARQHRAGPAGGLRRDPDRRGDRPRRRAVAATATAATPGSTRTRARSSRWPRRTATSPSPVPTPVAVTNCLNFGSPEDPTVMWQFAEAVRGLADGCAELGIPVTGGNVSFYNQTGAAPIHPTPVVGVLGMLDDVAERVPMGFGIAGDALFLLGETREELSGSRVGLGRARPPRRPPAAGRLRRRAAARRGDPRGRRAAIISAAHDLSDGGLAQALVESCLRGGVGAAGHAAGGHRPVRRAVHRVDRRGPWSPCRPGTRRTSPRCARPPDRPSPPTRDRWSPDDDELAFAGQFSVPLERAARGLLRHAGERIRRKLETTHRRVTIKTSAAATTLAPFGTSECIASATSAPASEHAGSRRDSWLATATTQVVRPQRTRWGRSGSFRIKSVVEPVDVSPFRGRGVAAAVAGTRLSRRRRVPPRGCAGLCGSGRTRRPGSPAGRTPAGPYAPGRSPVVALVVAAWVLAPPVSRGWPP